MESKKRAHSDEDEPTSVKKRILSGENGSPRPNGANAEDQANINAAELEHFRKEAIYRKMMHYSRENERSQARITELEKRKNQCEAGLAAISACWTQIIETIRLLVQPEDLPQAVDDIFDLTPFLTESPTDQLKLTLERSQSATHSLVSKFVQLGPEMRSNILGNEAYRVSQAARSECAALRSEMDVLRVKLRESEEQKVKLHEQLTTAENRCERLRSMSVLKLDTPKSNSPSVEVKTEIKEEIKEEKPSSPAPTAPPQVNGTLNDSDRDILKIRNARINELEQELDKLRTEVDVLKVDAQSLPLEVISGNLHYAILVNALSKAEYTINEYQTKYNALIREAEGHMLLKKSEDELAPYLQEISDLKAMVARRDADLSRVRDSRDQQLAELNERKQKDSVKMSSLHELKTLVGSQSERISVLESQLHRRKVQLAARTGNEELFKFILGEQTEIGFIEDLQRRLESAEQRTKAFEQAMSELQARHPDLARHTRTEAEMLEQISFLRNELQRYQQLCGGTSVDLLKQLEQKDTEIRKLQMADSQRETAEASLYSEVDKISAAWEVLEKQVKNKVFDLANLEDRLSKSGLDKAKSENKFYTCMREKEAIEAERKSIARNLEKQAKVIEKLVETERSLTSQTADFSKEVALIKRQEETHLELIRSLSASLDESKRRVDAEKLKVAEALKMKQDREKDLDGLKSSLRQKEEELIEAKNKFEKELSAAKALPSATPPSKLQQDHDRLLLLITCGTCKKGFREVAITRCMHTFCKKCMDDRVSSRQRKCPACNTAFAQSEVQNLYFQ